MDNSVYLLSQNMNLIKCFINCDGMGDIFKLEGLSTNLHHFDCKLINEHESTIIVIDHIGSKQDHLVIIKQIQKLQSSRKIKLIYTCDTIDDSLAQALNQLSYCKIFKKPLDFISFLNWIQNQDKEKVEALRMEKEVLKHLKYIGISASVLGFTYLKEAVIMKSKQSKIKLFEICDKIARKHQSTSDRVERCMRSALEKIDCDRFAYLGVEVTKLPCKDFIVCLTDYILNNDKE